MSKPLIDLPYAILIGLTPLIPVPFVDDWIASLLMRRMVNELGLAYGMKLTPQEVDRLIAGEAAGCLGGCLSSLLLYPLLKRILREVFFVLEWQRAINFVSHSYYYAFLLDTAFENGWYHPRSLARAAQVNAAIHRVQKSANTNLVRRVVEFHFNNSKAAVTGTARWMFTWLRKISLRSAGARLREAWRSLWRRKPRHTRANPAGAPPEAGEQTETFQADPVEAPVEVSVAPQDVPASEAGTPEAGTPEAGTPEAGAQEAGATAGEEASQPPPPEKAPPTRRGLRGWFSRRGKKNGERQKPPASQPRRQKSRPIDEVLRMEYLWLRVGELAVKIQEDLTRLPREHYDELKRRLGEELNAQK
jgi:hypothetical protein